MECQLQYLIPVHGRSLKIQYVRPRGSATPYKPRLRKLFSFDIDDSLRNNIVLFSSGVALHSEVVDIDTRF